MQRRFFLGSVVYDATAFLFAINFVLWLLLADLHSHPCHILHVCVKGRGTNPPRTAILPRCLFWFFSALLVFFLSVPAARIFSFAILFSPAISSSLFETVMIDFSFHSFFSFFFLSLSLSSFFLILFLSPGSSNVSFTVFCVFFFYSETRFLLL